MDLKMKKIILFLSIFLISAQSGFAENQTFFIHDSFTLAPENDVNLIDNGDFTKLAEQASPAVVDLQTESNAFIQDPFFQYFFQSIDPFSGKALQEVVKSSGSAVIISANGYLITCAHVVNNAKKIAVHLADRRIFTAKIVASYPTVDLAILKIDNLGDARLPFLKLGTAKTLKNGAPIVALGNSFNLGQTFTNGIISAVKRRIWSKRDDAPQTVIQHNAAVNPGNSGGALVNKYGHLIGLNNAIYSKGGGSNGVSFAIPVDLIIDYLTKFFKKTNGCVFGLYDLSQLSHTDVDALRQASSFTYDGGVIIASIKAASPAAQAGLKPKDIIVSLNDRLIESIADIRRLESTLEPTVYKITVWRDGKTMELTISPRAVTNDDLVKPFVLTGNHVLNGVKVAPLTPDLAAKAQLPANTKGFVIMDDLIPSNNHGIDVIIGSGALVREGDILLEANGKSFDKPEALNEALSASAQKGGFAITLWRKGQKIQLSVGMPKFNMSFD